MIQGTQSMRILLLSLFFTQAWCMESSQLVIVKFEDLKELVQQCSKEAVAAAIKKESPSFFSSTFKFIANHPKELWATVAYGAIVATFLGFSRSKFFWSTPKKFDALLEAKETELVNELYDIKNLIEASRANVGSAYLNTMNGLNAGIAAIDNSLGESKREVEDVYSKALARELNRRLVLIQKATITSRFTQNGINTLDSSLFSLQCSALQEQEKIKDELAQQGEAIAALDEDTEKEFDTTTNTMTSNHDEESRSLHSLGNQMSGNNEDIRETLLHVEITTRVLAKKLPTVDDTNEENKENIREAFKIIENQAHLIAQLQGLVQETQ